MSWGILVFAFVCMVVCLFATYMAFFHDWGSKHFLIAKKYRFTPFFLLALFGERFYVIYYKVGVVSALIATIGLCIWILINWE